MKKYEFCTRCGNRLFDCGMGSDLYCGACEYHHPKYEPTYAEQMQQEYNGDIEE